MGEKKRLRRELERAQEQARRAEEQRQDVLREQTGLLDALASLGLVWVGGERRATDRLRAARAGVLVLDDVHVLPSSQTRLERDEIPSSLYGFEVRHPGPIRGYATLEIEGDPGIIAALGDYVSSR